MKGEHDILRLDDVVHQELEPVWCDSPTVSRCFNTDEQRGVIRQPLRTALHTHTLQS